MSDIQAKPRWLDLTINVQSLMVAIFAAVGAAVVMWYTLSGRVSTLEERDRQHEARFASIDRTIDQQRTDMKEQLRNISSDVKDTNQKIDALTQQLLINNAGNRPDIRRWAK